jgi:CxxC-x17-CxxC domain-containing protein
MDHNMEVIVMSNADFADGDHYAAVAVSPAADLQDVSIHCIDCSKDFVWSAGEQAFFRDKRLENPPKRCKECKKAKNERLAAIATAQQSGVKQRIEVIVSCAKCGESTTVPFYPSQGRPVYCRSCFLELNPSILNGNQPSES